MVRASLLIVVASALALGLGALLGGPKLGPLPALAWVGLGCLVVQWLVFVPAFWLQTERFYDLTGSITTLGAMGTALALAPERTLVSWLAAAAVTLWAGRLGTFLFLRIRRAGADRRFTEIKTQWTRFLVAWTLQGLWVFLTSLAALRLVLLAPDIDLWVALGGGLWVAGFGLEVLADRQKSAFRARRDNAGRWIDTGLWAWSRHPNYFGEIVLWSGMFVAGLGVWHGTDWLTLISPLFVILLLTRVSGIPLLERAAEERWGRDPSYLAYRDRTPVLVPRPPRG